LGPITISVIVFACVFGGGFVGTFIHSRLPNERLDSDSREAVRLGMALVGTTVALVLGLLIASGKGFYDTQNSEVTQLAADVVLLDKMLNHYGPETKEMRELLHSSVARMVDATWERDRSDKTHVAPPAASEALFDKIQELSPHNDSQRFLQAQALSTAIKLGQTRSLMVAQRTSSVPMPLLIVLVFWLTLLFMSFGLFVRPNVVVVVSLFACALAVCAAILLILEMYQPYGGLIQVSSAPLRAALSQLGQ
jgi:Kef-type K+ transport system membrane component KefB